MSFENVITGAMLHVVYVQRMNNRMVSNKTK